MNSRTPLLMFTAAISCLLLSCSHTNTVLSDDIAEGVVNNSATGSEFSQNVNYNWVEYADPKADANLAIEKKQFNLLVLNNTEISFPGVSQDSGILQQKCGYKLIGNTRGVLETDSGSKQLERLRQYATTYNRLVSAACAKSIKIKED